MGLNIRFAWSTDWKHGARSWRNKWGPGCGGPRRLYQDQTLQPANMHIAPASNSAVFPAFYKADLVESSKEPLAAGKICIFQIGVEAW